MAAARPKQHDRWLNAATAALLVTMAVEALQLADIVERFPGQDGSGTGIFWSAPLGVSEPSVGLSLCWGAVLLTTAALVLRVLWRAHLTARRLGMASQRNVWWFVLSWAIPIVNLIVPYQTTAEVWDHATDGSGRRLLRWWWAAWVLHIFRISNTYQGDDGVRVFDAPSRLFISASLLAFAGLTIAVLHRINAAQNQDQLRDRDQDQPTHRAVTG